MSDHKRVIYRTSNHPISPNGVAVLIPCPNTGLSMAEVINAMLPASAPEAYAMGHYEVIEDDYELPAENQSSWEWE